MRLWIGGSSGLTQTYINTFPNEAATTSSSSSSSWILIGRERQPPLWMVNHPYYYDYIYCDLLTINDFTTSTFTLSIQHVIESIKQIIRNKSKEDNEVTMMIDSIVVGIRPQLVCYQSNREATYDNHRVVIALQRLLYELLDQFSTIHFILHISSIAAIDHISKQHLHSIKECYNDPSYSTLHNSYDRFKRHCEQIIEGIVQDNNIKRNNAGRQIQYTNLRLGAIFSDTSNCIQCTALALQMYTGPYLSTKIDCNSSYNVSQLIQLMLQRSVSSSASSFHFRPVYYYTRCISQYPNPVPYGEYLNAYKKAYQLSWIPILIPNWIVEYSVVRLLHGIIMFLYAFEITIPYLDSIDYLLQVTLNEHTFDMKETLHDFPNIVQVEETIEDCFTRRKRYNVLKV
jgi:hypothetical protein